MDKFLPKFDAKKTKEIDSLLSNEINSFAGFEQLSTEEIHALVKEGIAAVSAKSMQDMGKLIGHLKPKFEGKADMSIVSRLVKELLN